MAGYRHNGEFRITEHSSRKAGSCHCRLTDRALAELCPGKSTLCCGRGGQGCTMAGDQPSCRARHRLEGVLQALASMTGKNIVLSGQISQTITADLENVTPMEAIRHVADTGGLQIRDAGDILFVAGEGGEKSAGLGCRMLLLCPMRTRKKWRRTSEPGCKTGKCYEPTQEPIW